MLLVVAWIGKGIISATKPSEPQVYVLPSSYGETVTTVEKQDRPALTFQWTR